jgi:hypothetical protein
MEKFKELVLLCNASVEISVNDHKDYYKSVEQHINEEERGEIEDDIFDEMVKRNTIVKVMAYSRIPVGFFVVYHYDIDMAVNIALEAVKNDQANSTLIT